MTTGAKSIPAWGCVWRAAWASISDSRPVREGNSAHAVGRRPTRVGECGSGLGGGSAKATASRWSSRALLPCPADRRVGGASFLTEGVRRKSRGLGLSGEADFHGLSPCFSLSGMVSSVQRQSVYGAFSGRPGTQIVPLSPERFGGGTAVASSSPGRAGARSANSPSPPVARTRWA
jgi:hypothetical protein